MKGETKPALPRRYHRRYHFDPILASGKPYRYRLSPENTGHQRHLSQLPCRRSRVRVPSAALTESPAQAGFFVARGLDHGTFSGGAFSRAPPDRGIPRSRLLVMAALGPAARSMRERGLRRPGRERCPNRVATLGASPAVEPPTTVRGRTRSLRPAQVAELRSRRDGGSSRSSR